MGMALTLDPGQVGAHTHTHPERIPGSRAHTESLREQLSLSLPQLLPPLLLCTCVPLPRLPGLLDSGVASTDPDLGSAWIPMISSSTAPAVWAPCPCTKRIPVYSQWGFLWRGHQAMAVLRDCWPRCPEWSRHNHRSGQIRKTKRQSDHGFSAPHTENPAGFETVNLSWERAEFLLRIYFKNKETP